MKKLLPLFLLLPSLTFAQLTQFVTQQQYATRADMTFYMDPNGNDSSTCTAPGATTACRTFSGIHSKIPRILRHNITVNVAAGSYSFGSRWNGIIWSSAATSGSTGVTVLFEGPAFATHTPATGTSTGTLSGASITVNPLPILTDGAQNWTVDELRGRFITMTSGAASGVSRIIVANTATTITTTVWPLNPAIGDTYTLQTPAAIITGEQSWMNHTGGQGTLRFTRLEFTSSITSSATLTSFDNWLAFSPELPLCRILKTAGSSPAISVSRGIPFRGVSITGNTSAQFFASNTGTGGAVTFSDLAPVTITGHFSAYASGTTAVSINNSNSGDGGMAWASIVAETASITGTAATFLGVRGGTSGGFTNAYISTRCPAGSTGIGLRLRASGFGQTNYESTNCGTGLQVGTNLSESDFPASTGSIASGGTTPNLRCTNTTTCINVMRGGRMRLLVGTTMTGVTNEVIVDGVATTFAIVNALIPKRLTGNAGSIFEME